MAKYPRLVRLIIGVLVASIPATLVVAGVEHFIRERLLDFTILLWLRLWVTVSVVGLVIGYFNFMPPFVRLQLFMRHSEIDIGLIPFFKRLPVKLGTKLISISMEDHYAKVVTHKGKR